MTCFRRSKERGDPPPCKLAHVIKIPPHIIQNYHTPHETPEHDLFQNIKATTLDSFSLHINPPRRREGWGVISTQDLQGLIWGGYPPRESLF